MKRVLAISFIFVFLIAYITPITSVYATEVTWGDNNTYTWTNEQYEIFKKTAIMSMIPDLLSSGVNELSIENAEDVDDFVDKIIEFIEDNPDAIINTNTWSTLNDLNQAIQDKTEEIGNKLLENGLVVTGYDGSLHSVFEPQYNNTIPKITYKPNSNIVPLFNRLSRLDNSNNEPTVNPDPNYATDIDYINKITSTDSTSQDFLTFRYVKSAYSYYQPTDTPYPLANGTKINNNYNNNNFLTSPYSAQVYSCENTIDVNINTTLKTVSYTTPIVYTLPIHTGSTYYPAFVPRAIEHNDYEIGVFSSQSFMGANTTKCFSLTQYNDLSEVFTHLKTYFKHINIYVDNVPWSVVGDNNTSNNISIDINGMELYGGTNQPIQYYYPNDTKIDYQKLYLVIKRAIEDSLPISNTTIWEGDTYYDSHDNVYTPTIYNYYSDNDDESESDVLEDIINLAIVPKFDTALLQPIEEPITNGEKIMFLGVQSLPEDILFVIGAGFVLILFGAMINRLIE